jgi:sec-independent protein translocase protein TatA
MFNTTTLIILLVLALLIFGSRLPSLGKNLGKGIVSFKKGLKEATDEDEEDESDDEIEEAPRKKPKQLAAKTGDAAEKREKQKVPAADEDDE